MRTIERTRQFKRDYKRELKGRYGPRLDADVLRIVQLLAADQPLAVRERDHQLSGDWRDFRDCHVHPDLVLIYQKPDDGTLRLVRLGSHSALEL